jgi:hypothetical protein
MKYGALFALCALCGTALAQPGAGAPLPPSQPAAAQVVEPNGYWSPPDNVQPQAQPQPNAPTRATFVSTGEAKWDVWIDQQPACATPCTVPVMPLQFIALRTQERNPVRLDVGYLPHGDLMVTAKPMSEGLYAGGIVMTSFAGMGVVTGVTLTAVGCSTDHPTMCKAGVITTVPSAIGLYLGIYWMRKALPRAVVERAQPYVAANSVGVAGSF